MSYPDQVASYFDQKRGRISSRIERLRKRGRTLQAQQAEEELSKVPQSFWEPFSTQTIYDYLND